MGESRSTMEEERYKVQLFDGSNFNNWFFRLEVTLDENGLNEYIEQDLEEIIQFIANADEITKHKKNDKKCKSMIVRRIADSHLEYIKDKKTSKEVIDALKATFERKSIASQLFLRKKLLTLKCSEDEEMQKHFLKFDCLIRELKATGATLEGLDIICHLLLTMPDSYGVIVTTLETMDPDKLTIEFVKNRLLDEACKRKNGASGSASNASENIAMNANGPKFNKTTLKCYHCGAPGHKRSNCRKLQRETQSRNNKGTANVASNNDSFAFVAANADGVSKRDTLRWCIDSGATEHLVNNKYCFAEIKNLKEKCEIGVAKNGVSITATKIGTICGTVEVDGKMNDCTIKNVMFIPNLMCNLLSVRRLEEAGLKTVFENGIVKVMKDEKLVIKGVRRGKLYEFDLKIVRGFAGSVGHENNNSNALNLWHRRFGHLNIADVKRLSTMKMVDGIEHLDKGEGLCESCVFGKQNRKPFLKSVGVRSKRALELIHSDVCGPITPNSINGHRYIVSFIDDYTHFTMVYLLTKKSEVFEKFREYKESVTSRFGQRIVRLRCDNGGEYRSEVFKKYCIDSGIQIEYTVPYTPEQNGVAERMNRTLLERARTMMLESGLPKFLWSEAVICAVYLTNRSPTKALQGVNLNKTPAELWFDKKPDVSKLKVFGCIAYTHVPKEKRGKLDMKSQKNVLVGYAVNGYRLWDIYNNIVVIARDIIFDEKNFYNANSSDIQDSSEYLLHEVEAGNVDLDVPIHEAEAIPVEEGNEDRELEEEEVKVRRGTRDKKRRPLYDAAAGKFYAALALNAESYIEDVPMCYSEIAKRDDAEQWLEAVKCEMNSLLKNNTWSLTKLPLGRSPINCKWVFKRKTNGDQQYKARLVAKGFTQRKGLDYEETYSPVVKLTTIRIMLAVAVKKDWHIHQMDVKTAFLNGNLDEEIYMRQPEGFVREGFVCKLNKSLYGLKQASRKWNECFHSHVTQLGFKRSEYDYCLYIKSDGNVIIYLLLYVDDLMIVTDNEEKLNEVKLSLSSRFEMKDMKSVKYFLGLTIERDMKNGTMSISQKDYLVKVLQRFGMENCNGISTPMECSLKMLKPDVPESSSSPKPYRELIGCLMYVMMTSRPDLSAAVNYLSQFQSCATDEHWQHLKRVLRYIKQTIDIKMIFNRNNDMDAIIGYADADWANDVNDRRSVSGNVFKVFGSTVSWMTRKQPTVSLSSTEAEFISLSVAACEATWIGNVLKELSVPIDGPITMYEDNQACIHIADDPREHRRMKHIDVKYNHIRELISNKVIKIEYKSTKEQLADIMTKGLPTNQFVILRDMLGLLN